MAQKDWTEVALFEGLDDAESGREQLVRAGFAEEAVHVRAPGGARAGGARSALTFLLAVGGGGIVGAVAFGVLGYFSLRDPSTIGAVADGATLTIVVGLFVVMGGAVGGTSAALFSMGFLGDPAMYLTQEVQRGRVLVSVHAPHDRLPLAAQILRRAGSFDVMDCGRGETAEHVP